MIYEIRTALSSGNCNLALEYSTQLFESQYSNNEIRMMHASAYGCIAGIKLYPLIDDLSNADLSNVFSALAELFPSTITDDVKLQSLWIMQDVLQSVLVPGTVLNSYDSNVINDHNTGSVLLRDRTDDSNILLMFSSMANVGVSLNRYGSPDPISHAQGVPLLSIWPDRNAVNQDPEKVSCAIASAMANMYDGVEAAKLIASGPLGSALSTISTALGLIMSNTGTGNAKCIADGNDAIECSRAAERLRYRESCYETDKNPLAISSYAVGVLGGIDAAW